MFFEGSNIKDVLSSLAIRVDQIKENAMRDVATSMVAIVRDRVHTQGVASDGTQIGEYSKSYMSVRTGIYTSNETITKGKRKGETRREGVYTKGKNKGAERPKYNRSSDRKVILSLTRQMEGDLSVQPSDDGNSYGIGYNNSVNFDKAKWAEENYKKKIFALTDSEKEQVIEILNTYSNNILNGGNI